MIRHILLTAVLGAAVGLGACDEKKPAAPAGGTTPSGGAAAPPGAMDASKTAVAGAVNSAIKDKDALVAASSQKLADMEKTASDWKAKLDALSADAKPAATKLMDDFKGSLTQAKDSVSKLKDATAATYADLSKSANDALKKTTDAFNALKSKLGA